MKKQNNYSVISIFLLVFFLFLNNDLISQVSISGIVQDADTGDPLVSATVQAGESFAGTTTNLDGSFTLELSSKPSHLLISYIGFSTLEFPIGDQLDGLIINLSQSSLTTNEVIVTAQHQDQLLQDVPMSISVIDQAFLEKSSEMNEIEDLVGYAPGLTGKNLSTSQANYTIRGIGTNVFGIGAEASVGVFSDGMYNGRTAAAGLAFFDASTIEVLKGPQGTLFGRNASAGVVSIRSNKPTFKKQLEVGGHFGNWGQLEGNYILNLPVSNKFAVRLAGKIKKRDGLRSVSNLNDHQLANIDALANRLSILFKPSNTVNFTLRVEQTKLDGGGVATKSTNSLLGATTDAFAREFESDFEALETTERKAINLTGNFVLNDNLSLQTISAYNITEQNYEQDTDGSPVYIINYHNPMEATNYLQEIRLKGISEKVNWMVAGSIFKEDLTMNQSVFYDDATIEQLYFADENGAPLYGYWFCEGNPNCINNAMESVDDEGNYTGYSLYGNSTFSLTNKLNLTVGLRYSYDKKEFSTVSELGTGFLHSLLGDNFLLGAVANNSAEESYSDIQPRIALDYKINEDVMLFCSYNKGFKTGGFNTFTASPFDSESNNAYELGFKSSLADNKVKFNLSTYYSDYSNLQVLTIANAIVQTSNAGNVESKGVELESSFSVVEGFDLMFNLAFNKSEYKDYQVQELNPVTFEVIDLDFTGNVPNRSPQTSFSIICNYQKPIGIGNLNIRADYVFQSEEFYTRENVESESSKGYGLLNASIGIDKLFDGKVNLGVFGTNLANKDYIVYAEDLIGLGALYAPGVPRLIGVRFNFNNVFEW